MYLASLSLWPRMPSYLLLRRTCIRGTSISYPNVLHSSAAGLKLFLPSFSKLIQEMKEKRCLHKGSDQGAFNWLFYNQQTLLPSDLQLTAVPYQTGAVTTIGAIGSIIRKHYGPHPNKFYTKTSTDDSRWLDTKWNLIDDEGYFIQLNGKRSPVVHQFDRFGRRFFSPRITTRIELMNRSDVHADLVPLGCALLLLVLTALQRRYTSALCLCSVRCSYFTYVETHW